MPPDRLLGGRLMPAGRLWWVGGRVRRVACRGLGRPPPELAARPPAGPAPSAGDRAPARRPEPDRRPGRPRWRRWPAGRPADPGSIRGPDRAVPGHSRAGPGPGPPGPVRGPAAARPTPGRPAGSRGRAAHGPPAIRPGAAGAGQLAFAFGGPVGQLGGHRHHPVVRPGGLVVAAQEAKPSVWLVLLGLVGAGELGEGLVGVLAA